MYVVDGEKPGPMPTMDFLIRRVFTRFSRHWANTATPLLAQLQRTERVGDVQWGGSNVYWDVRLRG